MNEPSNFGTNSDHPWYYDSSDHPNDKPLFCPSSGPDAYYDVPPFHTQAGYQWGGYDAKLSANTVCMFAVVNRGQQRIYDVKNVYGLYEIIATRDALLQTTGKRGQVISRSTFPSAGHYGGHWLGDNSARWEDLRSAIIGAQEFNMFGITHVGSDVCGFLGNTTEELCLRWQQAGAFHSFFRNHNDIKSIDQDPPQWSSVAAATRTANLFRYRHLSYLYTLHFASSLRGGTVVRPVFFEYPTDFNAYDLSHQFMWGNAMLVAPAVYANVDEIPVYLPYGSSWYPLYGSKYGVLAGNGKRIVEAPRNSTAPVFARCGHVVPRQEAALTTMGTHENDFQLLITLPKTVLDGKDATATGELFWDDGVSAVQAEQDLNNFEHYHFNFKFTITNKKPQLEITLDRKAARKIFIPSIEEIEILGYPLNVDFNSVKVNGNDAHIPIQDSSYDSDRKILLIRRPESGFVFLSDLLDKWVITWNNQ
ncbi:hypothetical protein M3Y95_00992500 [Aphelenchoides besseyi]|nr:hypothetical protein M3Y95_00992500 [Aphelenchoides besseyi]